MVNKPNSKRIKGSEKPIIIFQVLLIFAILYFTIFFFPNITGARTPEMLQISRLDEYAQYPHVIPDADAGIRLPKSLRNFIIYLHYF